MVVQGGEHDGQLYLARQVEVQPVFNREFIAELSDVASANLLSLENLLAGDATKRRAAEFLADGTGIEGATEDSRWTMMGADSAEALEDLEEALVTAVKAKDHAAVAEILKILVNPANARPATDETRSPISRILWRAVLEEEPAVKMNDVTGPNGHDGLGDGTIPTSLLDFSYVDDINGRTSLHEVRSFHFPRSFCHFPRLTLFPSRCRRLVLDASPSLTHVLKRAFPFLRPMSTAANPSTTPPSTATPTCAASSSPPVQIRQSPISTATTPSSILSPTVANKSCPPSSRKVSRSKLLPRRTRTSTPSRSRASSATRILLASSSSVEPKSSRTRLATTPSTSPHEKATLASFASSSKRHEASPASTSQISTLKRPR